MGYYHRKFSEPYLKMAYHNNFTHIPWNGMQSHDNAYLQGKLGNTVGVPKRKRMILWKASGFYK